MIRIDSAKPRILIVALDNVGDLVFASALVAPLLAKWPQAEIDVWSKHYTSEIARLIPGTQRVIAADPFWAASPGQPRASAAPFLRSIAAANRGRYDVALLSGAPWRTAAAVSLSRIPSRVGLARHRNSVFLTHTLAPEQKDRPVLREQARLLEPLGIASEDPRYLLDPSRLGEYHRRVRAQLPELFVALHPFAGNPTRCVSLGEWSRLSGALLEQGLPTLWLGTRPELARLRDAALPAPAYYVDQLDDGSFSAAAAGIALASVLVGHDSGPLHVAGAFGVPVVGVFAPGEPLRTFPQGIGPWRMLSAPDPAAIDAAMILREIEALQVFSAS